MRTVYGTAVIQANMMGISSLPLMQPLVVEVGTCTTMGMSCALLLMCACCYTHMHCWGYYHCLVIAKPKYSNPRTTGCMQASTCTGKIWSHRTTNILPKGEQAGLSHSIPPSPAWLFQCQWLLFILGSTRPQSELHISMPQKQAMDTLEADVLFTHWETAVLLIFFLVQHGKGEVVEDTFYFPWHRRVLYTVLPFLPNPYLIVKFREK